MNNFMKTQDKFVQQIDNSKKLDKLPHAIMIEGTSSLVLDMAINYVLASLLCKNTKACFNCDNCNKVISNTNTDVITFDLDNEALKKENIMEIQSRFSTTALEETNKQVYVIKSIEKASSIVLNALLKFLEEPHENVYAIFTTFNKDKVLATIASRVVTYKLQRNDIKRIKEIFYEDYDVVDVDLVSLISSNEVAIRNIIESDVYKIFKTKISTLLSSINTNSFYLRAHEILVDYEKEELEIFFDLFYLCLTNKESQELLQLSNENKKLINDSLKYNELLDSVLSSRLELNTNMNKALIIDKFSIEVEEAIK